jgi:hypothetical protein
MNRDRLPPDAASEVLRLESLLLEPEVRRDRSQMEELLADDFVEFGASGRIWSREAIIAELDSGSYAPPMVENFECRILCPEVLLVTYRTLRASSSENGKTDEVLRSSIWRQVEFDLAANSTRVAAVFPSGNTRKFRVSGRGRLEFVAAEELVFFALWAVCAFKAADE